MTNSYRKTWVAPSGRRYVYRGLNPFEVMEVYGGLPEIKDPFTDKGMPTPEALAASKSEWMKMIVQGTVSPRVIEVGEPGPGEALFNELGPDMTGLRERIMEETGLLGKKADEARSFRTKRGKLRPASRNGKGHGEEAKPVDADSEAVSRPSARVRPHRVDQGEAVACGPDENGVRG